MTAILSWLASFLSAPIVNGVIDGYKAKLAAGNDKDRIAVDLAARELEVQRVEIEAQNTLRIAQIGKWYEPEKLFAYIIVIYFAKVIIWDKVFGWGTTDPINGMVAEWAMMVMMFYFGKRGVENVAKIVAGAVRK